MPSKNMLPKGKRRQSVKADYRAARTAAQDRAASAGDASQDEQKELIDTASFADYEPTIEERAATNNWITTRGASGSKVAEETYDAPRYANPYAATPATSADIHVIEDLEEEDGVRALTAEAAAAGLRLDAYLAKALPDISRGRVQLLIESGQIAVDGAEVKKSTHKLKGGERIEISGEPQPAPLHAEPEDIPLEIVHEDDDLAVVNKPAGMMVHAGAGGAEHNRGTLVNALLGHFGKALSGVSGELRPGIVHRLDKNTSGLIVVAKNDTTHRALGTMFSERALRKTYIALVQGVLKGEEGTVALPIARDMIRRTRMTTRRHDGRSAVSHWRVLERIESAMGKFTLLEVRIETGRTHQIRVHLSALGHPVVGDTLYGAATKLADGTTLDRNFLHATELEFAHPRTGKMLALHAGLPEELNALLEKLRG
jgi:23S rRNA pseudouridine1911/1915/1917 synthase